MRWVLLNGKKAFKLLTKWNYCFWISIALTLEYAMDWATVIIPVDLNFYLAVRFLQWCLRKQLTIAIQIGASPWDRIRWGMWIPEIGSEIREELMERLGLKDRQSMNNAILHFNGFLIRTHTTAKTAYAGLMTRSLMQRIWPFASPLSLLVVARQHRLHKIYKIITFSLFKRRHQNI